MAASSTVGPFAAVKGTCFGLFSESNQVTQASAGSFTFRTTAQGSLSGSLQTGTGRYTLSGRFEPTGNFTRTLLRPHLTALNVTLTLNLAGGEGVTGNISDGVWTAGLTGGRAVFDGKRNLAPQTGRYTLVIPGDCAAAETPCGDSYGTLSVSRQGSVRLSGVLADGTKFTQAAGVSENGQWPLYARLYSGQGSVWSWLTFTNPPAGDLGGELIWLKPPLNSAKYYPAGFALAAPARGSAYLPPEGGARGLGFKNAWLWLSGGELAEDLSVPVVLDGGNRRKRDNPSSLSFSTRTGVFHGSVVTPGSPKALRFSGVLFQNQSLGWGHFLAQARSGRVRFSAANDGGYVAQFQTLGSTFAPAVSGESTLVQSLYWSWSDGTTSVDYPSATKDFGSAPPRQQYLTVTPAEALVALNIGFDQTDGGDYTPLPVVAPQNVGAVRFPAPLTRLRYWASSYNPITNTLDFTGFKSLEVIECFGCTNLQYAKIAKLPALRRVCLENCALRQFDLSGDPNLEDLRGAQNAYTRIVLGGGTGPKIQHWCTRDNPQLTQQLQSLLQNLFSLREFYVWNDNQSGALSFVSTNLTDVRAQDNAYTDADFSGHSNLVSCWVHNNRLKTLQLNGCTGLQELDAHHNQLTAEVLDRLLALLDTTAPNLRSVDLSQNAGRPSSVGYAHYTNLVNRGVRVTLDF